MAMHSFPPRRRLELSQPCVAPIVEVRDGEVSVLLEGEHAPTRARVASTLGAPQLREALAAGHSAIVVFERGDASLPIVVGLLAAPDSAGAESAETSVSPGERLQADVDGKRVVLTGQDEIVLQCGKASITLRRNGRVVIRGTYVETYATGTNRIKGGQVLVN